MKILALDSTALTATVALCEDERLLGEYTVNNGNTHSENLLPMVEHLLKMSRLSIRDLDLLACSAGPGSFTGVRIGAATVKGLAFGTNIPCIGVSTLDALAENLNGFGGLIVPAMNARRGQVYTALFRDDKTGRLTRLTDDLPLAITELGEKIAEFRRPGEDLFFCGDGYDLAVEGLAALSPREVPVRLRWQSAFNVAKVARRLYEAGVRTTDCELVPTYLRPSQAERERNENHNPEATV